MVTMTKVNATAAPESPAEADQPLPAKVDTKKRCREEADEPDDDPPAKGARVESPKAPLEPQHPDVEVASPSEELADEEAEAVEVVNESSNDDSSDDETPAPPDSLKLQVVKPEMTEEEAVQFQEANNRRIKDDRAARIAHSKMLKAKAEADKAQEKYEECQRLYSEAKSKAELNIERDASALLLEPTSWNTYYRHLQSFYERNGHCNFKRIITSDDVAGLSEEEEKTLRTLSWWTCRQRKNKRRGELEGYKIHLLNRLHFEWNPNVGPGPEKWMKSYNLLKEFKIQNGHVKVPIKHVEQGFKLGSWLKTQITQYRNAQDGKQPALCAERTRMLEELGVEWGQKRQTTSWDERFDGLLDFKKRYGHVNVPWQWKEDVSLAQWVNSQRKKYKDLSDGKSNNLSAEQINRLNSIGFKWNTGGRGRYTHEAEPHSPINPALPRNQQIPNVPNPAVKDQGVVLPIPNPNYPSGPSNSGPGEGSYPPYFNRFPPMDPRFLNEHFANAQRFAQQSHQNNDPNFSYLQYAYHMSQLNQLNNPANPQTRESNV